jgi:hypothetical protein
MGKMPILLCLQAALGESGAVIVLGTRESQGAADCVAIINKERFRAIAPCS